MQDLADNAQPTADSASAKIKAGAGQADREVRGGAARVGESVEQGGASAADGTRSGGKQLGDKVYHCPSLASFSLPPPFCGSLPDAVRK